MKKSFIKRRKRVMPANSQDSRPRHDQTSSVSVSPDPKHSTLPLQPYETSSDLPQPAVNIDPMLHPQRTDSVSQDRTYHPPPIDFTTYVPPRAQVAPTSYQQVEHHYDPVHDHETPYEHNYPQHPSSKRRRSSSPARTGQPNYEASIPSTSFVAANLTSRHKTNHPLPEPPRSEEHHDLETAEAASDSAATAASKVKKKAKARYLAEQIAHMQKELNELGGDESGEDDDRGEG